MDIVKRAQLLEALNLRLKYYDQHIEHAKKHGMALGYDAVQPLALARRQLAADIKKFERLPSTTVFLVVTRQGTFYREAADIAKAAIGRHGPVPGALESEILTSLTTLSELGQFYMGVAYRIAEGG